MKRFILGTSLLVVAAALVIGAEAPSAGTSQAGATTPAAKAEETGPKEWTIQELVIPVDDGLGRGKGRNFERGKELFEVKAGCLLCHNMAGVESTFGMGPDLTGMGGRMSTGDMLRSIIQPSETISDIYGTYDVYLKDGTKVIGRMISENQDKQELVLHTNLYGPATGENLRTIKYEDIDGEWEPSPVGVTGSSPMPEGLLNALTLDEIKDLIGYMVSGGDRNARMYMPVTPPAGGSPATPATNTPAGGSAGSVPAANQAR